jgi:hypothetical protein
MSLLRYVVLHHTGIESPHYDLMLELTPGSDLATWRSPRWPPLPTDESTQLANHRRDYLEYEGPVSGNRGEVKCVGSGGHQILEKSPTSLLIRLDNGSQIKLFFRV